MSIWDLRDQYSQEGQYIRATSGGYGYEDKGRWVVENGTRRWHVGPGLIRSDESLVRDPKSNSIKAEYDLRSEPGMYLAGLTPSQRVAQMRLLADAGFINPNSIGDYNAELNAITNAMELGNFSGLEWSNAVRKRLSEGPVIRSGGGQARTYTTSSPDDLKKIANKVAQDTLGRELTSEEISRFAKAYQDQEIAFQRSVYGGGTVQEAPSIDVAAETFAEETAPKEAGAYEYLNYMNKLFGMIGVG